MRKKLARSFFARDTRDVAKDLLGKFLVREVNGTKIEGMITETEAYHGRHDKASHGHKRMTKRTEPMYASPGTMYVYLIYGMYHCLNFSTVEKDFPGAVLIRSAADVTGPGRVARHFKIDRSLTGRTIGPKTGLWVEDRGVPVTKKRIHALPRVGVEYAGVSKRWHWRYLLK